MLTGTALHVIIPSVGSYPQLIAYLVGLGRYPWLHLRPSITLNIAILNLNVTEIIPSPSSSGRRSVWRPASLHHMPAPSTNGASKVATVHTEAMVAALVPMVAPVDRQLAAHPVMLPILVAMQPGDPNTVIMLPQARFLIQLVHMLVRNIALARHLPAIDLIQEYHNTSRRLNCYLRHTSHGAKFMSGSTDYLASSSTLGSFTMYSLDTARSRTSGLKITEATIMTVSPAWSLALLQPICQEARPLSGILNTTPSCSP